jgi:hypothetical protein
MRYHNAVGTTIIILTLTCSSALPLAAAEPVILTGFESSGTTQSWAGNEDSVARHGPYLDIDYRAAVAERAYWGTWYTGRFHYDTDESAITDSHTIGLRIGGSAGSTGDNSWLLHTAFDASSDLGDETTTLAPEWSAAWTQAFSDAWSGTLQYSGLSRYQDSAADDRYSHGVDLDIAWEPNLRTGYHTGPSVAVTTYPDWTTLTAHGAASDTRRRDIAAEYRLGAEGLLGYFTLWGIDAAGGYVASNANRLVDGDVEQSQDKTTASMDLTLSTRPTRILSVSAAVTTDAAWYTDRTPLDQDARLLGGGGARTYEVWTAATVETGWRLGERVNLLIGADGGHLFSNDELLRGWTVGGRLGVEYRF